MTTVAAKVEPKAEAKVYPRPHAAQAYWMERTPGTSHWSVWQVSWEANGKPILHRLTESTTYSLAKMEVWRRTINEGVEIAQREGF